MAFTEITAMDLSDYFEVLKIASFSVVGIFAHAVICAVFSLVLMLIFRKTIMVKRAHIVLKVLAVLWFVLVPLLAGYYGFKWKLIDGIEDAFVQNVGKLASQLNSTFNTALQTACTKFIEGDEMRKNINSSPGEMVDKLSVKIYEQYQSALNDTSSERDVKSKVAGFFLNPGNSDGISHIIKKGISKSLEKTLNLDENRTGEMMSKKLNDVVNANIFNEIVEAQVRHFFGRMKRTVVFMFLLILFFPALEVGIAHWLHRSKRNQAA